MKSNKRLRLSWTSLIEVWFDFKRLIFVSIQIFFTFFFSSLVKLQLQGSQLVLTHQQSKQIFNTFFEVCINHFTQSMLKTKLLLSLCLLITLATTLQTVNLSDIQTQTKLQWSFVSQIQHTWFKNIVNTHFPDCQQHKQLKALYDCHTTLPHYRQFWKEFIDGIELIKFGKQIDESGDHSWAKMMVEAAQEWITVNKTGGRVQIEQAYEDISGFPGNLMEYAQFLVEYGEVFGDMQRLVKWERRAKAYPTKKDKTQKQMKQDQTTILQRHLSSACFQSQASLATCTMPLTRYCYYLKDLFFYYFDQPARYSKHDPTTQMVTIDPILDYKITKLWRDMRGVMTQHLGLAQEVTLDQVEEMSADVLESVMESLVRQGGSGGSGGEDSGRRKGGKGGNNDNDQATQAGDAEL